MRIKVILIKIEMSRIKNLSRPVANELPGFMGYLGKNQEGSHETDKVKSGDTGVGF